MANSPPPNRVAQWILLSASAIPIAIGVVDVWTVNGPGDQKMSAGMGLAFIFIPLSFFLALISAIMTCTRWRAATNGDKLRGLIPLSFPILAILLVSLF